MPNDQTKQSDSVPPICIVVSRYNARVTGALERGAIEEYVRRGGDRSKLGIVEAPGAFELVTLASSAAGSELYAGVCCLGCVIKGETDHDRYISEAVAQGLAGLGAVSGFPAAFGLLTVNNPQQAEARAGGEKGNKGAEAMAALLDTIAAQNAIEAAAETGDPGLTHRGEGGADKTVDDRLAGGGA